MRLRLSKSIHLAPMHDDELDHVISAGTTRYWMLESALFIQIKLTLVVLVLCATALIETVSAKEQIDPSNPTQLNTSLNPGYDYREIDDATVQSVILEGQVAGPGFLFLGELGYGSNNDTDKSDWRDARLRFFHLPYENKSPDAWLNAGGWSIDVFYPIGDFRKGVSGGYRIISPGVVTAHELAGGKWALYPNLIYNFGAAQDDDLKAALRAGGKPRDFQSLRFDFNISPKFDGPWYLMLTPSYTWNVKDADSSAYIRLLGGRFITQKGALNLEAQYNTNKDLTSVREGEKYYVRLSWFQYF